MRMIDAFEAGAGWLPAIVRPVGAGRAAPIRTRSPDCDPPMTSWEPEMPESFDYWSARPGDGAHLSRQPRRPHAYRRALLLLRLRRADARHRQGRLQHRAGRRRRRRERRPGQRSRAAVRADRGGAPRRPGAGSSCRATASSGTARSTTCPGSTRSRGCRRSCRRTSRPSRSSVTPGRASGRAHSRRRRPDPRRPRDRRGRALRDRRPHAGGGRAARCPCERDVRRVHGDQHADRPGRTLRPARRPAPASSMAASRASSSAGSSQRPRRRRCRPGTCRSAPDKPPRRGGPPGSHRAPAPRPRVDGMSARTRTSTGSGSRPGRRPADRAVTAPPPAPRCPKHCDIATPPEHGGGDQ